MQKEIVVRCRQAGKPVIVASHLLQSMIEYPTPTRAEVCSASEHPRRVHMYCWDAPSPFLSCGQLTLLCSSNVLSLNAEVSLRLYASMC